MYAAIRRRTLAPFIGFLLLAAGDVAARAREILAGPIAAEVVRTVDGDTLEVRAKVWLRQEITVAVRIRGIDAPEMRARCPREKEMAEAATAALAAAVEGHDVRLVRIEDDKYGGRVLADVVMDSGASLAEAMLASGLVRAYQGGTREAWCGVASAGG